MWYRPSFTVKFHGPTTHRGAHVSVKSNHFDGRRIYLPYDYEIGDPVRQAYKWIESNTEYKPVAFTSIGDVDVILVEAK